MDDTQNILDRLTKLEGKSIQVDLQPTERENLKNNLFEGFGTPTSSDAKVYLDVIWKDKHYFIPTGLRSIFSGSVASNGTATSLPTGWTSTKDSTGVYTVTHNLGSASYAVVVTAVGPNNITNLNGAVAANTFGVAIQDSATQTLNDKAFNFILTPF